MNLIPFNQMTPERHRELSAKGGRASGVTRRKKADMRRQLIAIMKNHAIAEDLQRDFDAAVDTLFKRDQKRRKDAARKRRLRRKQANSC